LNTTKLVVLVAVMAVAAGCATRRTPAPVFDARAPKAVASKSMTPSSLPRALESPRSSENLYTVKRGDTLYSIALEHGADYRELSQWNGVDDPARLRVGQQLRVRAPAAVASAEAAAAPAGAPVQVGPARILGRVESRPLESLPPLPARAPAKSELARMQVVPKPEPVKSATPTLAKADAPVPGLAQFIWPAKGKVLAEFAEPRRKGIDIDGKPGDPIVAAAPGRVTYIGSGIPGMGKLVVLKHDNGFITVYAHNRNILVKEQQAVARGQRIAELGSTDSERPKLHFQIRKGAAAVDPLLYLPK
jgi:lipoprotein NlpD